MTDQQRKLQQQRDKLYNDRVKTVQRIFVLGIVVVIVVLWFYK